MIHHPLLSFSLYSFFLQIKSTFTTNPLKKNQWKKFFAREKWWLAHLDALSILGVQTEEDSPHGGGRFLAPLTYKTILRPVSRHRHVCRCTTRGAEVGIFNMATLHTSYTPVHQCASSVHARSQRSSLSLSLSLLSSSPPSARKASSSLFLHLRLHPCRFSSCTVLLPNQSSFRWFSRQFF